MQLQHLIPRGHGAGPREQAGDSLPLELEPCAGTWEPLRKKVLQASAFLRRLWRGSGLRAEYHVS